MLQVLILISSLVKVIALWGIFLENAPNPYESQ